MWLTYCASVKLYRLSRRGELGCCTCVQSFGKRFKCAQQFDADRILMPVFGPAKILGMFDDMNDILSQLVLKWERSVALSGSVMSTDSRLIDSVQTTRSTRPRILPGLLLIRLRSARCRTGSTRSTRSAHMSDSTYLSSHSNQQETKPSFVGAMSDWLTESGNRFMRPAIVQKMLRGTNNKYEADMKIMRDLADQREGLGR